MIVSGTMSLVWLRNNRTKISEALPTELTRQRWWTRDEFERNQYLEYKMVAWLHSSARRNVASVSWFGPFLTWILTFKWVKVSISFNFMFFIVIQDDVSQSELIGPGLVVRVDPVRLLYLPILYLPILYLPILYCFANCFPVSENSHYFNSCHEVL